MKKCHNIIRSKQRIFMNEVRIGENNLITEKKEENYN